MGLTDLTKIVLSVSFLSAMFVSVAAFSKGGRIEEASTDEWNRRDAFVNPEELGEKVLQDWRGGSWNIESVKGSYRFVITEHSKGRDKLYLQWYLANGELAYSMSVKELNIRPEYSLTLPQCEDGDRCQKLKVSAKHYFEENSREFRIHLDGLGSYQFSF